MSGHKGDHLEVVMGWLPGQVGESLAERARGLAPAVLYGDRVTMICPQSDDVREMWDYFDLRQALPDVVEFDALDSMCVELDAAGNPVRKSDGSYNQHPFAPQVWSELVDAYIKRTHEATVDGDHIGAQRNASMAAALLNWGYPGNEVIVEALATHLPDMARTELVSAVEGQYEVRSEVMANWLLGAFIERGMGSGRYPLLDDAAGLLTDEARLEASSQLTSFARIRASEAALSAVVLGTLPSPRTEADWTALADIRKELRLPLRRFRAAMAELAATTEASPLGPEFDEAADHILRTKVWTALAELEELVREATFRQVFFRDVAGDLSTYAGPIIGLGTAMSDTLPTLVSATVSTVTPLVASISHGSQRRREAKRHEFFFVHEAARRLGARQSD